MGQGCIFFRLYATNLLDHSVSAGEAVYVKSKMTINLTMLLFEGAAGGPVKGDARLRIIQGSKSKTGDAR